MNKKFLVVVFFLVYTFLFGFTDRPEVKQLHALKELGPNADGKKKEISQAKANKLLNKFNQGAFSLHPFGFIENKGQILDSDGSAFSEAKFEFMQGNTKIFLLEKGIAYQFTKTHYPAGYKELKKKSRDIKALKELEKLQKLITSETYRMDMTLKGANVNAEIVTEGKSEDVINYYSSNSLNVHYYDKITYREIYPGIDWIIYSNGKEIKYDFVVKPGAEASLIKMEFTNQKGLGLNEDGSFTLENTLGTISEKAPVSYQGDSIISTAFILTENVLSFNTAAYNKTENLIIDPALMWATYYGGSGNDEGFSCATDASGNIYLAGETSSSSNIASGGYQNSLAGFTDAFLVKFNSAGVRQWATYYGGTGINNDRGYSCATDLSGNVYLSGMSSSGTGIASGGHQNTFGGGFFDAFLVKFDGSGVFQWGTYYGGNDDEYAWTCTCDGSGNVFLAGTTASSINIGSGGHQNSYGGGSSYGDAFLVKFNSAGVRQWGTYYGGAGEELGYGCVALSTGVVYLSGLSSSTAGIASGGFQNALGGPGTFDAFLVKFNAAGVRQWGTYYGDTGTEGEGYCSSDATGAIYLSGLTNSSANMASGGHQNTYSGGSLYGDLYLVKFNPSGGRIWATYYGGSGDEQGGRTVTDASNNVYLSGMTGSSAGIASLGYQNTYGGSNDAFLVKFNSAGTRQWGTYYGGNNQDGGRGCDIDPSGNIYLCGTTASSANIASGGHQNIWSSGSTDAFLAKFCDTPAQPSVISGDASPCSGISQTYSVTNDVTASFYTWSFPGSWTGSSSTNVLTATPGTTGVFSVTASNACGASPARTLNVTVLASPAVNITPSSSVICSGNSVTLTASGASTYVWSTGSTNASIVGSPANNITRTVTGTAANGCTDVAVQTIIVNTSPTVSILPSSTVNCSANNVTLSASGASTYTWSTGFVGANLISSPNANFTRTVTGTAVNGCTDQAVQTISVNPSPTISIAFTSSLLCSGNTSTLTASGADTYVWISGPTNSINPVTPLATTNYTVTGTISASGCTDTAVQSVSVITSPTAAISVSPGTVICSGAQATLTASGGGTYVWSNGGSTNTIITISPANTVNRTVTVTAANGCTDTAVQTVSVNASPTLAITNTGTVICSGKTTTLTATGANTYVWTGGPSTAAYAVTPLTSTNYTVIGTTSASGCTDTAVQSVSVNTSPTVTIVPTSSLICSGKTTTLTAGGANTYVWTGGPATAAYAVTPLTSTNYTVTGTTAASGCTDTAVQTVSVNASPTVNITNTGTVICSGKTTTLTAGGANTYVWTGGPSTAAYAVTPLTSTNYTVIGTTSASGCTDTAVQTVSVNASPTVNVVFTSSVLCAGNTSTLTAGGANTYVWTGGPSTAIYAVTPLSTTNFTVTGTTSASGCTYTAVQTVSVNANPTVNISNTGTLICSGKSTTLTAGGANTYVWTGGPSTAAYAVTPLTSTNYTVIGTTSASGCTDTAVQTVSVNASPTVNVVFTSSVLCAGNTSTLTAGGANTYVWTGGPSTAIYAVTPLSTTNFTVTGTTSASGCTYTAVQTVSVNANPTVNISNTGTLICSGKSTTLTAGGANTYVWTGGPSTAAYAVTPLSNTNYTVTGTTSASGCSATAVQNVSVNATPNVTISPTTTLICSGASATLSAGGAASYVWSGGPSTASYVVAPLSTIIYTVTGTTNACTNTAVQSVSVNSTPVLSITPSSTLICSGKTATLTASGAVSYVWSNGPVTAINTVSPVSNISYTVTGTTNGCTNTAIQSMSVNTTPTVTIVPSSTVICSGNSATLTGGGASTYIWSNGPTTASNVVNPVVSSSYTLTGTSSGCTNTAVMNLSVNASPVLSITVSSSVICIGQSVVLSASGANSYSWTPGPALATFTTIPVGPTFYQVTGTNSANGCTGTSGQVVLTNPNPTVNITASSNVMCAGNSVSLTAGGSGVSTYTWSTGSSATLITVSPSTTTTYTLIGSAAPGCTSSAIQSINVNPAPSLTISAANTVLCTGNTTTLNASGANTYVWSGGPTTFSYAIAPLANTVYTLTGTSVSGCTSTITQSISVIASLVLTITPSSSSICSGKSATLTALGASTYTWLAGGPTTSSYVVSPTSNTTYTVTGTAGTCTNVTVQTITVNALPSLSISATATVLCAGKSSTLSGAGAASYTWSGGPSTAANTITPLTNTIYTLTGSALNGCTNTAVQSISVNALPALSITASSTLLCAGASATLSAAGAATYTWSGGPSTANYTISPLSTTVYTLTGTAVTSGCTNTAQQSIVVNAIPVLTITLSAAAICAGQSATLTASGATTYSWTNGPATAVYTLSPTSTAVYTLSGLSAGCTGTAVATVSVNANPTLAVNSGTICTGNSFTISATGAANYSWTTGALSPSIIVTPATSTLYLVTGTGTNNCSASATASVVVANILTVSIVPSNTAVCAGTSVILTANGANTFTWSNATVSSSIVVSPLVSTSYSVIGSSGPTCSNTATQLIGINPSPTISISGASFVCAGTPVTLNASGASTYTWNTGSNASGINVTPTITTIFTVIGSNSFSCTSASSIQVKTTTLITPSLCLVTVDSLSINNEIFWEKTLFPRADTFIVFRESSAAFYTPIARISKNAPGSFVDTDRTIGPNNGDPNYSSYKYKIQYKDSCGNLSALSDYHKTIFIQDNNGNFNWNYYNIGGVDQQTVNYVLYRRSMLTGITTSVNGTSGTAMTDPQYGALAAAGNVKWYVGMSGFSCNPGQRLAGTAAATISTTKSNTSNEKQYPVLTVGLRTNDLSTKDISVYPSPVETDLSIDFAKARSAVQVEVKDLSGRLVRKAEFVGTKFNLNLQDLKNGIYFITLYESNQFINTYKIVVQHE